MPPTAPAASAAPRIPADALLARLHPVKAAASPQRGHRQHDQDKPPHVAGTRRHKAFNAVLAAAQHLLDVWGGGSRWSAAAPRALAVTAAWFFPRHVFTSLNLQSIEYETL